MSSKLRKISHTELRLHSREKDGWIALNGTVWDFSDFSENHPGGPQVILESLGQDRSDTYNEIHSPGLVRKYLGEEKALGTYETADLAQSSATQHTKNASLPDLGSISSLWQFEGIAKQALTDKAWLYISSATGDRMTHAANAESQRQIMFIPRVLKGVGTVDISTSFLGQHISCPILVAPSSSVKLTHWDGELALARASQLSGVPPIIPSMGSYSVSEVVDALQPGYPFCYQTYVKSNHAEMENAFDEVRELGARAIVVTVDLPVISKREAPMTDSSESQLAPPPKNNVIDPDLDWEDIRWIIDYVKIPVFLKGIQCAEDAKRAFEIGCRGIYLSNHGGRALDSAQPPYLVLLEIQMTCPEILDKMEVIIDGGFVRGDDILKAICLGANVVCIGRPFLYALAYGEEGVVRAFQILQEELRIAMQLLGITDLSQASMKYLNTRQLQNLLPLGFGSFPQANLERCIAKL